MKFTYPHQDGLRHATRAHGERIVRELLASKPLVVAVPTAGKSTARTGFHIRDLDDVRVSVLPTFWDDRRANGGILPASAEAEARRIFSHEFRNRLRLPYETLFVTNTWDEDLLISVNLKKWPILVTRRPADLERKFNERGTRDTITPSTAERWYQGYLSAMRKRYASILVVLEPDEFLSDVLSLYKTPLG